MSAYTEYLRAVRVCRLTHSEQREGQAAVNVLHDLYPHIAQQVWDGPLDPFYMDDRLPAFLDFVREALGDSVHSADRH